MSADFERLLQGLASGAYRVELDVPGSRGSSDLGVAGQLAAQREESIRRGVRIARVFHLAEPARDPRRPAEQISVTDAEAVDLMDAGATWEGPAHLSPRA
jgi:hypothetical protein